ncbi:hypothetical protein QE152_g38324 [Popillia japonica]|uniref:Uncharacterized protein n=1 Tax=Popillia japonica TaxID=7064 RepID=A0AAW1I683_POPJA
MKTSSLGNFNLRANNKSKAAWDYIRFKKGVSSAARECNLTANDFNDFFVRVGPEIISNSPPSPVSPEDLIPLRNIPSLSLGEVSFIEVKDVIVELASSNTPDLYDLSSNVIKLIKDHR